MSNKVKEIGMQMGIEFLMCVLFVLVFFSYIHYNGFLELSPSESNTLISHKFNNG